MEEDEDWQCGTSSVSYLMERTVIDRADDCEGILIESQFAQNKRPHLTFKMTTCLHCTNLESIRFSSIHRGYYIRKCSYTSDEVHYLPVSRGDALSPSIPIPKPPQFYPNHRNLTFESN